MLLPTMSVRIMELCNEYATVESNVAVVFCPKYSRHEAV
jgi:hypothetical protein